MNYFALLKGFCKEAFDLKQYKHLGPIFGTIAFIAVLPFVITSISLMLTIVVLGFVYNALESSVRFLESWLEEQKKSVRHATEAVLYFICMPWIFFCMALLSSFAMIFYFLWFSLQVSAFIATLGGISWQPFITYASYSANKKWRVTTNSIASIITVIALFVFFIVYIILYSIGMSDYDEDLILVSMIIDFVYALGAYIAVPLIFKKVVISEDKETSEESEGSDSESSDGIGDYIPEI